MTQAIARLQRSTRQRRLYSEFLVSFSFYAQSGVENSERHPAESTAYKTGHRVPVQGGHGQVRFEIIDTSEGKDYGQVWVEIMDS
jgi:signal transduction histidine kinase